MVDYKLIVSNAVKADLRSIENHSLGRILDAIRSLAVDPLPSGCRKLKGAQSSYRIRVGDYRIIYDVDAANRAVTIFHVRHRRDAY